MKPLVYIAGPYTEPEPVDNTRRAIGAGMGLYDSGKVAVIIPHLSLVGQLLRPRPIDYWYLFDRELLAHCHALYRLKGFSVGADLEVDFAIRNSIPVFDDEDPAAYGALMDWAAAWHR